MTVVRLPACMDQPDGSARDEERQLVERAKHDRQAFAALYRRHYRAVASHVFRRTGDVHVTEDLVADVFLIALRTLPRYRYRGVPVRFWLLRIATNTVNRWIRRRRRGLVLADVDVPLPATAPGGPGEGSADGPAARRALLTLSPKHQAVLALHYLEDLTVDEVAAVIGCRPGTVKSRLARAREALRTRLNGRR